MVGEEGVRVGGGVGESGREWEEECEEECEEEWTRLGFGSCICSNKKI